MVNITDTAFHGGEKRHKEYYTRLMETAVKDGRITERDRRQIAAFISEVIACGEISNQRRYKIAYQLVGLRKYLPEFSLIDTSTAFSGIERFKAESGFTNNTLGDSIKLVKRFLLWLYESGEAAEGLKPEKIRKLKVKIASVTKTADDILTPTQIEALFKNLTSTRNRAMVELLYESAGRAGEIATLAWGQVTFYPSYASIRLDGKTGATRTVPIYTSHLILRQWRDQFPGDNPEKDDLVFPARVGENKPMTYQGMTKIVRAAAQRAEIEKKITLHTFRHSRITHLLQAGMNESTIKLLAWGDLGSDMIKVYGHLVPGDIEDAFAKLYDIRPVEEFKGMDPAISPIQCPGCGMLNPAGNRFCGGCGYSFTKEAGELKQTVIDSIMADPAILRALADRIEREQGRGS